MDINDNNSKENGGKSEENLKVMFIMSSNFPVYVRECMYMSAFMSV